MKRSLATMALKFIDIGANLTDPMYQGLYHGSQKHEPDLADVLDRSFKHGLQKIMVTGGSLEDSKKALELAKTSDRLYSTVGCHPTRCLEFDSNPDGTDAYFQELKALIENNKEKVVAVGECGLDYDRLQFCDKDTQQKYFELQLDLCSSSLLPLFLHCRNSATDLVRILDGHREKSGCNLKGVVHSFDGREEEAKSILELGLFIGLNGCSLKTEANLEVVRSLPTDRLMIETDCPWCEVRTTHAGYKFVQTKFDEYPSVKKEKWKRGVMVKGRNEPCNIINVLEIISAVKEEPLEEVAKTVFDNAEKMFFPYNQHD